MENKLKKFEFEVQELLEGGTELENLTVRRAFVFSAMPFHIADGGQTNEGVSLQYIMSKTMAPVHLANVDYEGVKPSKSSIAMAYKSHVRRCPAVYDMLCEMVAGASGMQLKVRDVRYVADFEAVYTEPEAGKVPAATPAASAGVSPAVSAAASSAADDKKAEAKK